MVTVTNTLVERVHELIHQPSERPLVWGNPRLGATPNSIAMHDLVVRIEALEEAVLEIAFDVQRLSDSY